jgi:hypothetical protein
MLSTGNTLNMIKMNKIYMHRRNGIGRREGAHREQKVGTWPVADGQERRRCRHLREVV